MPNPAVGGYVVGSICSGAAAEAVPGCKPATGFDSDSTEQRTTAEVRDVQLNGVDRIRSGWQRRIVVAGPLRID